MEIYTIERPSMLPVLCAPTSASWLPLHESVVVTAAERAQLSQAHQARTQADLAGIQAGVDAGYGTNGFLGSSIVSAAKRMTGVASGVPPRGRPV